MKARLSQREPELLQRWEATRLYERIRERAEGRDKFILHDGPPYANGNIHLGTALNKILKDIIVKHRFMEGWDSTYVPGWDCHGLPIEHQVDKMLGDRKKDLPIASIRQGSPHSLHTAEVQGLRHQVHRASEGGIQEAGRSRHLGGAVSHDESRLCGADRP